MAARDHPVSTCGLGLVQGIVGIANHRLGAAGRVEGRNTERAGRTSSVLKAVSLHLGPESLRQSPRLGKVGASAYDHKLLAAPAAQDVGFADGRFQQRRGVPEYLIAALVPESVVDALEVVNIGYHHGQRAAGSTRQPSFGLDDLIEPPTVVETG
jgi:hypothetical protein